MSNNDQDNTSKDVIDPELAELLNLASAPPSRPKADNQTNGIKPNFLSLFGESSHSADKSIKKQFAPITEFQEAAKPHFKDPSYYNTVLAGGGDAAKKMHEVLTQLLNSKDPADRSLYKGRAISAFWELLTNIVGSIGTNLPLCKKLLLRFGVLLPSLVSPEQLEILSRVVHKNKTNEPLYYLDEWMQEIASGKITSSATDETTVGKKTEKVKMNERLEKTVSQYDSNLIVAKNRGSEISSLERMLVSKAQGIIDQVTLSGHSELRDVYSMGQRKTLSEIGEIITRLSRLDKEFASILKLLDDLKKQSDSLDVKSGADATEVSMVDSKIVIKEFQTIRQMTKLCVGKQGNHFPILMKQYFRANWRDIGTRENVIQQIIFIENLDPGLFLRTYKQEVFRIVPNIVLLPCYGEKGICWEPFEKNNKATGRGRVAIPMFPKELNIAVLSALADLRWQTAKEKALHYWMEEGITGKYYQYFTENKLKGDLKESFINDYILWITKESEGTQKLDRELRGIFWRNIPFPQKTKDMLKNKGFVYNELCKKDKNISMSDGY